jgi:hypothetical protein
MVDKWLITSRLNLGLINHRATTYCYFSAQENLSGGNLHHSSNQSRAINNQEAIAVAVTAISP